MEEQNLKNEIKEKMKKRYADEVWRELKEKKYKIKSGEATKEEEDRYYLEAEAFLDLVYDAIQDFDYGEVVRFEMTNECGIKRYIYLTDDWKVVMGGNLTNNTYLQDYTGVIASVEGERNIMSDAWKVGWITDEKEDENGYYLLFDYNNREWITEDEAIERFLNNLDSDEGEDEKSEWFSDLQNEFALYDTEDIEEW